MDKITKNLQFILLSIILISSVIAVGIEINANHVGSAYEGFAHALGKIIHKGRSTHVWNIEIKDDHGKIISICRLTMKILER